MKGKILKISFSFLTVNLLMVFLCNFIITSFAKDKTFNDLNTIPTNTVGIVLGTSKKITGGSPNLYYSYRVKAAIALFKAEKIKFILVSGDNGTRYYNEPATIKKDLIAGGIPEEKIFLDFAGFRTLDSMVRAKTVFGLDSVTVISQEFHNQRAIYLADKKDIKAIGFNATDVSGNSGLKVHFREYLARVKVFIDLILNTQPKFYGDHVEIK
jgi:SanA protein